MSAPVIGFEPLLFLNRGSGTGLATITGSYDGVTYQTVDTEVTNFDIQSPVLLLCPEFMYYRIEVQSGGDGLSEFTLVQNDKQIRYDAENLITIRRIASNEQAYTPPTGWAQYRDTAYTSLSPFSVTRNTTTALPNNRASVIESQLGSNVSFYDGALITPNTIGDFYVISVRFKAWSSVENAYVKLGIDIGGSQGVIIEDVRVFIGDAGSEHYFNITFPIYSLSTFKANGGTVKVFAGHGDVGIYDIVYVISKTHGGL